MAQPHSNAWPCGLSLRYLSQHHPVLHAVALAVALQQCNRHYSDSAHASSRPCCSAATALQRYSTTALQHATDYSTLQSPSVLFALGWLGVCGTL